ncbi:MAG: MlaD family protein [Spirochaetia bacterium]
MITEKQKYRLGFFLLIMAGSIAVLVFLIFGRKLTENTHKYSILFEDATVSGLRIGSTVSYQGLNIGTVEDITIDPQNVRNIIVAVNIDSDVPMRGNTKAALVPAGLTGSMRLELSGGEGSAPPLEPGSTIKADLSTIDVVVQSTEEILTKINDALTGISNILSDENRESVDALLKNVNNIILDNQQSIAGIVSNLETMTENLHVSMEKVNGLLEGLARELNDSRIAELSEGIQKTISETNTVIGKAGDTMTSVNLLVLNNERDILDAIDMFRRTAESLYDFSLQISDNPALLLRSR